MYYHMFKRVFETMAKVIGINKIPIDVIDGEGLACIVMDQLGSQYEGMCVHRHVQIYELI